MPQLISREHDLRSEIFPVLTVGVALNLVGHFVNKNYLGLDLLFLDATGTLFAAIALGPWWGAAVGVLSNGLNGLFTTSYFPFGVVNVLAGLVGGYVARSLRLTESPLSVSQFGARYLRCWLGIGLAVGLVAGLASTCTKLLLYPRMGLQLHLGKPVYMAASEWLSHWRWLRADVGGLLLVDLGRDLVDKLCSTAAALGVVEASGLLVASGRRSGKLARLVVDSQSLLVFATLNALALIISRVFNPQIAIGGRAITWLQVPEVVAWLYLPLVIALSTFFFGSGHSGRGEWASVEHDLSCRSRLYRKAARAREWQVDEVEKSGAVQLAARDGVYGILVSVLVWPYGKQLPQHAWVAALAYVFVILIFAVVFFAGNRRFRERVDNAKEWYGDLARALHGSAPQPTPAVVESLSHIFGDALLTQPRLVRRIPGATIQPAVLLRQTLSAEPEATPETGRLVLLAVLDPPQIFDAPRAETLSCFARAAGAKHLLALTTTTDCRGLEMRAGVLRATQLGIEPVLLGFTECAEALGLYLGNRPRAPVLLKALNTGRAALAEELACPASSQECRANGALADLALPAVQHLLQRLPAGSRVLDVGAGWGRHSQAALTLGHHVTAIEKQESTCRRLEEGLEKLTGVVGSFRVIRSDFVQVDPPQAVDLLIATGVLQHMPDLDQLRRALAWMGGSSCLVIEMLYDMLFDGCRRPDRVEIDAPRFLALLEEVFPKAEHWLIQRADGPDRRCSEYDRGGRTFPTQARRIEYVSETFVVSRPPGMGLP